MNKLNVAKRVCIAFVFCAATAIALPAQTTPVATPATTFTTLLIFCLSTSSTCLPSGFRSLAALVQGTDGDFYGTTYYGGANCYTSDGCGTVFKITPSGKLTTLHSFDGAEDGSLPIAGLVQGTGGNFYGTTSFNAGTVFRITAGGKLTTLHSFDFTDGYEPDAGLVQGTNGKFYGTTQIGGANGYGTVFSITAGGKLTTLHSFDFTDGSQPSARLVQGTNGKFYGTTQIGGANGYGTVFCITAGGKLTTLHSFDFADGYYSDGGLVQDTNGKLYGTTYFGGGNGGGTVFSITAGGKLTTLHSFGGYPTDGAQPAAGLVQGTNGKFYGTTFYGGANTTDCLMNFKAVGCGTVFSITPSGTLATLYNFCSQGGSNCTDGKFPNAGLIQGTNGTFYGTTSSGGGKTGGACYALGCGTVFSLSVGLDPFVKTNPAAGSVGTTVKILGTNLTGATSVTFNGTSAPMIKNTRTYITTTVPTGATTGTVQVVTPGGTLSSNGPFRVLP